MQKKKTLSCLQDNVFLIVFSVASFKEGAFHGFAVFSCSVPANKLRNQVLHRLPGYEIRGKLDLG